MRYEDQREAKHLRNQFNVSSRTARMKLIPCPEFSLRKRIDHRPTNADATIYTAVQKVIDRCVLAAGTNTNIEETFLFI